MTAPEDQSASAGFARFPTTRWSLIDRASHEPCDGDRIELGDLLRRYLPAMRTHLEMRRCVPKDAAEDIVQGFIADKVVDNDFLHRADRSRGKFRTFLATSLDNYLISDARFRKAAKRSPVTGDIYNLDESRDEHHIAGNQVDPFDLAWARLIVHEALSRMSTLCESQGRSETWLVFEARIVKPMLEGIEPMPYEQVIELFGFGSYGRATTAVHRAKALYVQCLTSVVAEYAGDAVQVEEELDDLRRILSTATE